MIGVRDVAAGAGRDRVLLVRIAITLTDAAYVLGACGLAASAALTIFRQPDVNGIVRLATFGVLTIVPIAMMSSSLRRASMPLVTPLLFGALLLLGAVNVALAADPDQLMAFSLLIGVLTSLVIAAARFVRRGARVNAPEPVVGSWSVAFAWLGFVVLVLDGLAALLSLNGLSLVFLAAAALAFGGSVLLVVVAGHVRHVFAALALTPIPVVLFLIASVAIGDIAGPRVFELPDGYRGWVLIQFEMRPCASSHRDGITEVIRVDPDGCGCSANTNPGGLSPWSFYYVDARGGRVEVPQSSWGGGGLIWGEYSSDIQVGRPRPQLGFFVGTEAQVQDQRDFTPRALHTATCLSKS